MGNRISILETRFECQPDCINCCTLSDGFVYLNKDEAKKIAQSLNLSEGEFYEHFIREIDDQLILVDGDGENCVFLEGKHCLIYEQRPKQCRTYPFWPENLKSKSRWKLTSKECPGIGQGRLFKKELITQIVNGQTLDSER